MQTLFHSRWVARLHFTLLLLTFGELVAWQDATSYDVVDWLAVFLIYFAFAMITLDVIVRFHAVDMQSMLLVAGTFGLAHGVLISLSAVRGDQLAVNLAFRALGVDVLMFLLAILSFRHLASGEATGLYAFALAAFVGFASGTWLRWFPELDSVNVVTPSWDESLPYTVVMLVLVAVFPLVLHARETAEDLLLLPYEWAAAGGVLFVTLVLRGNDGYIETLGISITAMLLLTIIFMLIFTKNLRREPAFSDILPTHTPHVIGWLIILIPFTAAAWLGYNLSDGDEPLQATLLFRGLLVFGAVWLPVTSILMGIRIMTQLTREGF